MLEVGIRGIARQNNRLIRQRPFDAKSRVIPAQPSGGLRPVEFRDLIKIFRLVFERLEPMSDVAWEIHHKQVFCRQSIPDPLAKRGRTGPQVNHDVENRSARAADQFGLSVWRGLIVKPRGVPRRWLWEMSQAAIQPLTLKLTQ